MMRTYEELSQEMTERYGADWSIKYDPFTGEYTISAGGTTVTWMGTREENMQEFLDRF